MKGKGILGRPLVAFLVTWAFAVVTVTGIVLYLVPQGRVAFWTDWRLLGLGKDDWAGVHMAFGAVFIVAGALHLYFNWKPFKAYLADRVQGHLHLRGELLVSLAVALLILAGAVARVPPVSWLFDLNDRAKALWAAAPGSDPPFGHAEESTLSRFTAHLRIDLDAAVAALAAQGFKEALPDRTMKAIAAANGIKPSDLYAALKPLETRGRPGSGQHSADEVQGRFEGSGLGRKTLAQACEETATPLADAQRRLRAAGIAMAPNDTFRATADRIGLVPMDILKTVTVEGYRPRTAP